MEFTTSKQDTVIVAAVSGRLDSNSAPQAQELLIPLLVKGARIVIDMRACSYVSSAGLRVLLWCAKTAVREEARVVVAGLSDDIREVMEMTGFENLFPAFDGLDEAVAAAKGAQA